jgi:xylan 1,4-beta-xylosidase
MLNSIGDEIIHQTDGFHLFRNSANGKMSAILFNYPAEVESSVPFSKGSRDIAEKTLATGKIRNFTVDITDLPANARFNTEILDADHGFALRDWQKIGSPEPPTREETQYLRDKALNTLKMQLSSDSTGTLHWDVTLSPWSVVLLNEA